MVMLEAAPAASRGTCPDCADERLLVPVDEGGLELCCVGCGAAFVTWEGTPALHAPSRVA